MVGKALNQAAKSQKARREYEASINKALSGYWDDLANGLGPTSIQLQRNSGLPYKTLRDRIKGGAKSRIEESASRGRLLPEEIEVIIDNTLHMVKRGFPVDLDVWKADTELCRAAKEKLPPKPRAPKKQSTPDDFEKRLAAIEDEDSDEESARDSEDEGL